MCLLSSVVFRFLLSVKLALCAEYLVLNDVAVSPMYCLDSWGVDTMALYTMFLAVHLPGNGHSSFFLQLHVLVSWCCCLFEILSLWALILFSIFSMQL